MSVRLLVYYTELVYVWGKAAETYVIEIKVQKNVKQTSGLDL